MHFEYITEPDRLLTESLISSNLKDWLYHEQNRLEIQICLMKNLYFIKPKNLTKNVTKI